MTLPQEQATAERARALFELGRYADAIPILKRVIAAQPENAGAWTQLAYAEFETGEREGALGCARTAISLAPENEWPYRVASAALRALGRSEEAADAARQAVRLAPHQYNGYVQLALAHARIPKHEQDAEAAALKATELGPGVAITHLTAGIVAAAAKRREDAAAAFHRALAIDPQNATAHNELARLQLRKGRGRNASPIRLATAATGFATAIRANPRAEASRRNLDIVMGAFLSWTAYFIFIDAVIANATSSHSPSTASRVIPIVLLAVPAGFALHFVLRLPPTLRGYVVRLATSGRTGLAAGCAAIAVAGVVGACLVGASTRPLMTAVAVIAAIAARVVLWSHRTQIAKAGTGSASSSPPDKPGKRSEK